MPEVENDYTPVVELLEDILGDPKMHNDYKCQMTFDCPVCSHEIKGLDEGDGKGNLEINYRFGVYKCWACGETHNTHGGLYKLVKKYGTAKQVKRYELLRPDELLELKKNTNVSVLPKEYISFKNASMGMKLTHHYRTAMNYLKSRNITEAMIEKFNIGFAYEGLYGGRIIVPSYNKERKLNYFIARAYYPHPKRKYRNPDVRKEDIIFNEHLVDWEKPIYVVEGAFDSIFVPNSIALLGKKLSEYVFTELYNKAKEIVIVLDGDAYADAERIYQKLNGGKLYNKIWLVEMPLDKDIADLQGNFKDLIKKQLL